MYVCQQCNSQYRKWLGKCENCDAWNSITEEIASDHWKVSKNVRNTTSAHQIKKIEVFNLDANNDTTCEASTRYSVGIEEFNRVLGGGIVMGAAILLCGEPGIGKSTLLLQLCDTAQKQGIFCLYISGEESISQIKIRAQRLQINNPQIHLAATTSVEEIRQLLRTCAPPAIIIIDSIQTLYCEYVESAPGTINQVRFCALELIKIAKDSGITLIIVGHITKDGQIAGPKTLEHMVDTVLYFEGDNSKQYRIVRAVKNRYGSTNEIGVFEMSGDGLVGVDNPSRLFMSDRRVEVSGACIFAGVEGSRSVLVEVQALVASSFLATPRRAAVGCDLNRLAMMLAILNSRLKVNLSNKEVYLNIVGGMKLSEPALDLAIIVSLVSAAKNVKIPYDTAFFGEVGLSGELRQVAHIEHRVNEAVKLGFKRVILPYSNKQLDEDIVELCYIKHIRELASVLGYSQDTKTK